MSFIKSVKSVFRRKKNKNGTKIGRNWENVVRANLKDDSFALRFFNNDDATLREIVREIELHEKIVHENILQFYGITKKETDTIYQMNKYILVMEHANSAIQLASAVLCLHENDICHNNMHANNILMHQKSIKLADFGGQRETIVNSTPIGYSELYNECWKLEPDERPDMQRIVSILRTLINKFELPKISVIEDNEEIKNDTSQFVKKFLKDNNVNIIPFDELENPVPLCEGGFGDIKKAIWRNKYVVYKRLINTTIQYNTLNAFIHELKIHLLLLSSYNDRIIHCFGVSQVDKTKEYLLVTQYADGETCIQKI
ncbi:unnamed protein product [Rhizophagus irregularis]|nr:unnamed protein product [Rhizophagus irregularis]